MFVAKTFLVFTKSTDVGIDELMMIVGYMMELTIVWNCSYWLGLSVSLSIQRHGA